MRTLLLLVLAVTLGGCSLFSSDAPKEKSFSLFSLGGERVDATPFLEYQRSRSEDKKDQFSFIVRNTHEKKTIEGEIRTTFETGTQATNVKTDTFLLGPNGAKEVFTYPAGTKLTYEVTAYFKQ